MEARSLPGLLARIEAHRDNPLNAFARSGINVGLLRIGPKFERDGPDQADSAHSGR
jgi:hypothetical protein